MDTSSSSRSPQNAFELILHLSSMSYAHLDDGGCGYGDRPSDEPADDLCCELARRIKDEDKEWSPKKEVDYLRRRYRH